MKDWFKQFTTEQLRAAGMLPEQRIARHKRCLKTLNAIKSPRHNELKAALRKAVNNG